ncbi:MAG: RNA polymerase sigma factor [Muribaculaceae bacterium]|nr:RNA polymerase sigma factor [Muribaculaceae bacterium]
MTRRQFISLVESRQRIFRRFFVALCCGDTALADDITQEALIKAYMAMSDLKDDECFDSWFYRLGYRTFLNYTRSRRISLSFDDAPELTDVASADETFRYQELYRALDRLSVAERTSILLFYMEGYQIKEIASIEGISESSVKQHLSRGRHHLRNLLK